MPESHFAYDMLTRMLETDEFKRLNLREIIPLLTSLQEKMTQSQSQHLMAEEALEEIHMVINKIIILKKRNI